MISQKRFVLFVRYCLTISFTVFLSACATAPKNLVTQENWQQAYQNSVKDAEIAEPDEIYRNLIAIVPYNQQLVWKNEGQDKRILMVTWTAWPGYDDKIGQSMTNTREVWVTSAPELKNFCTNLDDENNLIMRLEQLLGLPLGTGKDKIVELWVKPSDLFRPSADPAISDHEAEIEPPVAGGMLKIDENYRKWFSDLKAQSYGEKGYPWTRLGYTYDWGNPDSEIGLSEFVISAGATVQVHAVTPTLDYCRH